ncbi:MAG: hypothetical protein PVSMB4_17390 [Ktedonobacterales bacterium]
MAKLRWFVTGVVAGLTAAAISQELEKEPEERTWQGKIAGVPYNFRIAEWGAIAGEYWDPASDEIFTPHAIGLGWGVNFAALARRVQGAIDAQQHEQPERRIPEPSARR